MIDIATIIPANSLQRKIIPQKTVQGHPHQDNFIDVMRDRGQTLPDVADDQPHDREEDAEANADCSKVLDPPTVVLLQTGATLPDSNGGLRSIAAVDLTEKTAVAIAPSIGDERESLHACRKANDIGVRGVASSRRQEEQANERSNNSTILSTLKKFTEQVSSEDTESGTLALAHRRHLPTAKDSQMEMTTRGDEAAEDAVPTELASTSGQQRRPVLQAIQEQRRGGHVSDQAAATLNILSSLQPFATTVATPAEQIIEHLAKIVGDPTALQPAMGKPESMTSLTVVLEPESLGPVRVSLMRKSDGLHIAISAGKQGTAEMLQRDKDQLNVLLQAVTDEAQIAAITISSTPVHEGQQFHGLSERPPGWSFQDPSSGSQPRQPQPEREERSFPHKDAGVDEASRRMTGNEDPSVPGHALSGVVIV